MASQRSNLQLSWAQLRSDELEEEEEEEGQFFAAALRPLFMANEPNPP